MISGLLLVCAGYLCFAAVIYWGAKKLGTLSMRSASRGARRGPADIGSAATCNIGDPLNGVETSQPPSECVFHTEERDDDEPRRLYWTSTTRECRFRVFLGWRVDRSFVPPESFGSFLLFEHQAGGHGCYHPSFFIRPLRVHSDFLAFAAKLADRYVYHNNGWFESPTPEDEAIYRQELASGSSTVDSDRIKHLMESVYPFDVSDANIATYSPDAARVETLLDCDTASVSQLGAPTIYVISDNSD